ncbi:hypothetical protein B0F90DRAFT_369108 [Multifurca ochricompacta]|uniref:Uncharacterized protein n=1 Tax=Multifurca ochricompacta TaxID=376703 RepID=A0AAD4QF69_9AGAM|nr:hypothetical protein B0F90DRAFT_369108 [Multifurca ochricompacta]
MVIPSAVYAIELPAGQGGDQGQVVVTSPTSNHFGENIIAIRRQNPLEDVQMWRITCHDDGMYTFESQPSTECFAQNGPDDGGGRPDGPVINCGEKSTLSKYMINPIEGNPGLFTISHEVDNLLWTYTIHGANNVSYLCLHYVDKFSPARFSFAKNVLIAPKDTSSSGPFSSFVWSESGSLGLRNIGAGRCN